MNRLVISACSLLIATSSAFAKDFVVTGQELMPIAGTGADGKMDGVYHQLMKRTCEKLKYNCKFEIIPLARQMEMLKNGQSHAALGLARSPDREEFAHYPPMITQVGYTFAVKKGDAGKYSKMDDFKGMTIGVHGGSATGKDLQEQNKKLGGALKIVEEAVVETSLRKLAGGRYGDNSAAYCIRPMCILQAKKENLGVEPVAFDGKLQSHTVIFSKKSVPAAEFETWKKAMMEVASTAEFKKLLVDQGFQVHSDVK